MSKTRQRTKPKPLELEYEPIMQSYGGRCHLTIYPPGSWFNKNKDYKVFVAGVGRSGHKTLDAAERELLTLAVDYCNDQIVNARKIIEHYEHERHRLFTNGLVSLKAGRK